MTREQMSNAERCTPFYGEPEYTEEDKARDAEAWAWIQENGMPEDDELPF